MALSYSTPVLSLLDDLIDTIEPLASSYQGPCANCTKTHKDCTFLWLRSQEIVGARKFRSSGSSSKHAKTKSSATQAETSNEKFPFLSSSAPPSQALDFLNLDGPWNLMDSANDEYEAHDYCPNQAGGRIVESNLYQPEAATASAWSGTGKESEDYLALLNDQAGSSASSPIQLEPMERQTEAHFSDCRSRQDHRFVNVSPSSVPEKLAKSANQNMVTESLLRIYHDSLENALSCWLNERTCPYGSREMHNSHGESHASLIREWGPNWSNRICKQVMNLDRASSAFRNRPMSGLDNKAASNALNLAIMAFATQWSQSDVRRRSKLQSFDKTGRTIHTIESLCSPFIANDTSESPNAKPHFDRNMQHSFWIQARRALQDAAHIESFRVVFAHIIFGLTQKPMNKNQHNAPSNRDQTAQEPVWSQVRYFQDQLREKRHSGTGWQDLEDYRQLEEDLESVIEHDGPPIFLEQGLRHMHVLRSKMNAVAISTEKAGTSTHSRQTGSHANVLNHQDRKTIDLLYWLGVMFDTLSAAMHKRPLVISDEDSNVHANTAYSDKLYCHEVSDHITGGRETTTSTLTDPASPASPASPDLWDTFFLLVQKTRVKCLPTRWPCSYEDAAAALSDAAPIKVLLFRKVTRIQTLLSRHVHQANLETAIEDALNIYRYWNSVYGPFILDCVAHHDQLPARVQSWYICLTGHWHLGVLLLADMIQTIDEGRIGLETHRRGRECSGAIRSLRLQSANALADLARCSCPREDSSFPDANEFHFVVNKGAILTEPWTQVLIRVFSKAGAFLCAEAANIKFGIVPADSCREALRRSEHCVEALWYLGRKSDVAFLVANVLEKAWKRVAQSVFSTSPSLDLDGLSVGVGPSSSYSETSFQDALAAEFGLFADDMMLAENSCDQRATWLENFSTVV
ncbi:hypothetical protein FKW77_006264 [Venturia effusa]|uniref:Uncharacterized protein n=1 Tax=Venturia effusa TaxID=50376 RepID=A0A517LP67_9PEZI|nr:hypothetical protein FKW77_006264 [Venturia effusa]